MATEQEPVTLDNLYTEIEGHLLDHHLALWAHGRLGTMVREESRLDLLDLAARSATWARELWDAHPEHQAGLSEEGRERDSDGKPVPEGYPRLEEAARSQFYHNLWDEGRNNTDNFDT